MSSVAVVAVGGNSLIKDSGHQTIPDQYLAVVETAQRVADLVCAGVRVVLTHGNGPQVGFILRRSELARDQVHPVPLDVCVADTQGSIGYHFQQALNNEFQIRRLPNLAVTLVTQVAVEADDPAFAKPSKPVGAFMDEATAEQRRREDGWEVMEDAGRGWRRVVPSPKPRQIVEFEAIRNLIDQGFLVIAAGGGGIPVVTNGRGGYVGTAAVIDKDLASGLLASQLQADCFMISTGVACAYLAFGTPEQRALRSLSVAEAEQYLHEGHFKAGSMKPKMEAAVAFVKAGGARAIITNPENLIRAYHGEVGTEIHA